MIQALRIEGYRSIRKLHVELGPLVVIVGANGCGKTNFYRALYWVWAAAQGVLARSVLDEGGMPSTTWAGKRSKGAAVRVGIEVTLDQLRYRLECGLPIPPESAFAFDPIVKEEHVWFRDGKREHELVGRGAGSAFMRDAEGNRVVFPYALGEAESVLSQIAEPHRFPVASALRQQIGSWRFYHHFATEQGSPLRRARAGVKTPVLSHDGVDLAAALRTILEIGDAPALHDAIDRAFPGAKLEVQHERAQFVVQMQFPGIQRPLEAAELSDGTLRYLCLCAALLSPRAPTFLALNEPETSLHPDLFEPLAHLIVRGMRDTQICLTTHAEPLAVHLQTLTRVEPTRLEKIDGETRLA